MPDSGRPVALPVVPNGLTFPAEADSDTPPEPPGGPPSERTADVPCACLYVASVCTADAVFNTKTLARLSIGHLDTTAAAASTFGSCPCRATRVCRGCERRGFCVA
jgi:hypothetical protein